MLVKSPSSNGAGIDFVSFISAPVNYIQIPECLWPQLAKLSGLQAGIWADAWTWQQQGKRAYRTNEQLAEMFGCNRRSVPRALNALIELGYIELKYHGNMRYIHAKDDQSVTVTKRSKKDDQSVMVGMTNRLPRDDQSVTQVYHKRSLSRTEVNQSTKTENLIFPFDSDRFKNAWKEWKEYKRTEKRFSFKSEQSEQTALHKLHNDAEGNEQLAIYAIGSAIANGYSGIFVNGAIRREFARNSPGTGPAHFDAQLDDILAGRQILRKR